MRRHNSVRFCSMSYPWARRPVFMSPVCSLSGATVVVMVTEMSWGARSVISHSDGTLPAPRQRKRSLYDVAENAVFGSSTCRTSV